MSAQVHKQPSNGFFLTRDEHSASYAIILHNVRTYRSAGVVAVVKGKENAESTVKKFEDAQSSSDRHEGWRYFFEKTGMAAGTDPAQATDLRQADLESRESKALQEIDPPIRQSSNTQR
ncbi:MAG TPA: hypothetical protein VKG65_11455 [Terriglobales bacterium]|nr:hypothetical protein [Terriglobales bacterium]